MASITLKDIPMELHAQLKSDAAPNENVVAFMESAEWFVPAPVIAEIQAGAEASPSVVRKTKINT